MSSSKKLKMERLSPILMIDSGHANLSESCRITPCTTPKPSVGKKRDLYAIESLSSPEFRIQPCNSRSSSTTRKPRHSSVRKRVKSVSKKECASGSLLAVTRKSTLCQPVIRSQTGDFCSDDVAKTPHTTEDVEIMVEGSRIGTFVSPLKPKLLHTDMSPSLAFPCIQPDAPKSTPIPVVLSKKVVDHNRSLNDSKSILVAADDEISDEDNSDECAVSPSIECFESPNKPDECHLNTSLDITKSSFSKRVNFRPMSRTTKRPLETIIEECSKPSVEISGADRKKRKLALEFGSDTYGAPSLPEKDLDDPFPLPHPLDESHSKDSDHQHLINPISKQSDCVNCDLAIEDSPKSHSADKQDDLLGGFTVCSSLTIDIGSPPAVTNDVIPIIDQNSPIKMSQPDVQILEETSNDVHRNDDFNIVSHDRSPDKFSIDANQIEDETCHVNQPEVQRFSGKSPLNYSKRSIQHYESPSKVTKAFSEAINIDAFGSPDSNVDNNSSDGNLDERGDDDILNATSTQTDDEFVVESEQINLNKRRKKGSLLKRAGIVISRLDASDTLFDYEIKAQLRSSSGKFVSTPLVVCKLWFGDGSSNFLICKSLKFCMMDSQEHSEAERTFIVAILVNKIAKEISVGSVILLHYPLTIIYNGSLGIPYILAGNQIVSYSKQPNFINSHVSNINNDLEEMLSAAMTSMGNAPSSMKVFPFTSINSLAEAALCQSLVDGFELSLRVLHVVIDHPKMARVLCHDMENNFGWILFSLQHHVKRATALEALHILTDGASINVKGFHVFDRNVLDIKTRNLLQYCLNDIVENCTIFTISPIESNWVISTTGEPKTIKKVPATIDSIQFQKTRGKRFLVEISDSHFEDKSLFVTDSSGKSIALIQGELAPKIRFELLSTPFSLDGVYYYDEKIFSDEYTKIIPGRALK